MWILDIFWWRQSSQSPASDTEGAVTAIFRWPRVTAHFWQPQVSQVPAGQGRAGSHIPPVTQQGDSPHAGISSSETQTQTGSPLREEALPRNPQVLSELAFPPPHPFSSAGTTSFTLPSLSLPAPILSPRPSYPRCCSSVTHCCCCPSEAPCCHWHSLELSPPCLAALTPHSNTNSAHHTCRVQGHLHTASHQEPEWETNPLMLFSPLPLQQKLLLQLKNAPKAWFSFVLLFDLKTKPHNLSYLSKRRPLLCPPNAHQECPELWSAGLSSQ